MCYIFGCTPKTIERLRRRLHVTRNVADRPRSGRPCVTTAADECRFNLNHADGRERVHRRPGQCFADACVIEQDRFGRGSVLVWGGISGGNKTGLIVINGNIHAQTYINDVLAVEPLSFIQLHGPNVTFMQDNAFEYPSNNQAVFGDK